MRADRYCLIIVFAYGITIFGFPGFSYAAESSQRYSATAERQQERLVMVQTLKLYGGTDSLSVTNPKVIEAMLRVPRHLFIPAYHQNQAYHDTPLSIGFGQTISQPYIVALMTQLADIQPGMKVLEIGTGSGYQAAILQEITDQVYTMEIISPLAKKTGLLFQHLGLTQIQAKHGDGYFGWPDKIQFDRILVTAAAAHIPPPLLKQLKPGGRMVIPVGPTWGNQELLLITKDKQGRSKTRSLLPVRFVPLTGGTNY